MQTQSSVLVNEQLKIPRDFEIKRDLLISARLPDLVIFNKKTKTYRIVDLAIPADNSVKKESEKRHKHFGRAWWR